MNEWNFEELNKLCQQKNIPESIVYQKSLEWRWRRADFHAEKAKEIWAELFSKPVITQDSRFNEAVFSYEAHVEACIQSLHSMADMLAQIINVVILKNQFMEDGVYFKTLIGEMEKNGIAPLVTNYMKKLLNHEVFQYIDAFCNTIKHRRLINSKFRAEYGKDYRNESGIKFLQFNYKSKTYPETWGNDILEQYRFQMRELVTEVGLNINKFASEN